MQHRVDAGLEHCQQALFQTQRVEFVGAVAQPELDVLGDGEVLEIEHHVVGIGETLGQRRLGAQCSRREERRGAQLFGAPHLIPVV